MTTAPLTHKNLSYIRHILHNSFVTEKCFISLLVNLFWLSDILWGEKEELFSGTAILPDDRHSGVDDPGPAFDVTETGLTDNLVTVSAGAG